MSVGNRDCLRASIPKTDWPLDSESRHEILMTVLGLGKKATANGRRRGDDGALDGTLRNLTIRGVGAALDA